MTLRPTRVDPLIVTVLQLLKHLEHGQFIFVLLHEIRKVVEEHPPFRT